MSTKQLTLSTTRPATAQEVEDLVFGTGALTWPWWNGAHQTEHGFRFYYDDPDKGEGTFTGNKWVSNQQILNAAAAYLADGRGGEDAREALSDSIGYLDAEAADCVLQRAVLGKEIYG